MYVWIYKITNDINGKFYIGQTKDGIQFRFERHITDSIGSRHLNTHFAWAIRKYGPEHFHIQEIDNAESQEELTEKEYYWIKITNAISEGYNETEAKYKCGGNTYLSKSKNELDTIKSKISISNSGSGNGNARRIKFKNVNTKQELVFNSVISAQKHFNENITVLLCEE